MITIEMVYEKLVQLTDLCDMKFKEIDRRLGSIEAELKKLSKKFDELGRDTYDLRGRVAILEEPAGNKH
jgi:predicted nuclease with TOPRIM domain